MKKILIIVLLLCFAGVTQAQWDRIVVKDSIKLGGKWIDSVDFAQKLDRADTVSITASLSNRIDLKLTGTDTASLSNRIDLKMPLSDSTRFAKLVAGTPVNAVASAGKLTLADLPHDGDSLLIGTEMWYFKTTPTGSHEILTADSIGTAIRVLTDSINAVSTLVTAVGGGTDNVYTWIVVTAETKGVIGNSYDFVAYGDGLAHFTLSGVTLGVGTGATLGVDGTVGLQWDIRVDASYMYICIATNTTAGTNWRRITLGTAY